MNIDRNDKMIANKIDEEVRRFELLDKAFTKIYESEKQLKEKRISALELLGNIEDENIYLNDIYKIFKQNMIDLEKTRELKLNKLEKTIIPATKYYPKKIKEFKKPMNQIKDLGKTMESHQEKIQKAKTKSDIDTINKYEKELQNAQQNKVKVGNKLESEIVEFEANRVNDNKSVLLHFIHSELAYHSNALQFLLTLFQEINIRDPKEKLKDFINKYNLNTMKDCNLEDKFIFKDGETNRKLDDKNKNQLSTKKDQKSKYILKLF